MSMSNQAAGKKRGKAFQCARMFSGRFYLPAFGQVEQVMMNPLWLSAKTRQAMSIVFACDREHFSKVKCGSGVIPDRRLL